MDFQTNFQMGIASKMTFPFKLHILLNDAERNGFQSIITWLPHGKGFIVKRRQSFMTDILPNYFDQTKWKSFSRQLNVYGFQRVIHGAEKGAYFHPCFVRDNVSLCASMSRRHPNKNHEDKSEQVCHSTATSTETPTYSRISKSTTASKSASAASFRRQSLIHVTNIIKSIEAENNLMMSRTAGATGREINHAAAARAKSSRRDSLLQLASVIMSIDSEDDDLSVVSGEEILPTAAHLVGDMFDEFFAPNHACEPQTVASRSA